MCAYIWIHDLHSPSVFFPSCCPFHVFTFQFFRLLFRLWITQLPYADIHTLFPLSLAPHAAIEASTDACSSSAISVLNETFLSAASLQPWSQPTTPTSACKSLIPSSERPLLTLVHQITFFAYLMQSHKPQQSYCSHKVSSVISC